MTETTEAEAICEAADHGEWTALPSGENLAIAESESMPSRVRAVSRDSKGRRCTRYIAVCDSAGTDNNANAAFIAAAHTGWPRALAAIAELQAKLESLEAREDSYKAAFKDGSEGLDALPKLLPPKYLGRNMVNAAAEYIKELHEKVAWLSKEHERGTSVNGRIPDVKWRK